MLKTAVFFCALTLLTRHANADGIDCSKAVDAVDKAICASDDLKAQDRTMAELYNYARISPFGLGPSGEIAEQRDWLKGRKDCVKAGASKPEECIHNIYEGLNLELAFAVMPAAPQKALQVLNDQKLETAPVFEALTLFASEPDGTDWSNLALEAKRNKILALATPAFLSAQSDVIKDLLNVSEDSNVKVPEDILKSSKAFAGFLKAATYGNDRGTLPCGYVITHPMLLDAVRPYYGSTMDSWIIHSNCNTTTPPTPKFKALLKQINDGWPQCEGTIRFMAFGAFDVAVDQALAPSAKAIENGTPAKSKDNADEAHTLSGVSKAAIRSATRELSAYYVKYLRAKPDKATKFATAKITNVLDLGQQCGETAGPD